MDDAEQEAWARRITALRPHLRGPVYFLWGTDWEDAPVTNAARLHAHLPPEAAFDWPAFVRRRVSGGRHSITSLFGACPAPAGSGPPPAQPRQRALQSMGVIAR